MRKLWVRIKLWLRPAKKSTHVRSKYVDDYFVDWFDWDDLDEGGE